MSRSVTLLSFHFFEEKTYADYPRRVTPRVSHVRWLAVAPNSGGGVAAAEWTAVTVVRRAVLMVTACDKPPAASDMLCTHASGIEGVRVWLTWLALVCAHH